MLATRPCDPESSRWAFSKYDPSPRKHLASRMSSSFDTSLSAQQDWQGQYSYLPPDESAVFGQSFDHQNEATAPSRSPRTVEPNQATIDAALKKEPVSPTEESQDRAGKSPVAEKTPAFEISRSNLDDGVYTVKRSDQPPEDAAASVDTPALSMGSTHLSSVSSVGPSCETQTTTAGFNGKSDPVKEEDDDVVDDDEMLDVEGEQPTRPMTAAERTAARRKMKRFRLTHQQTRFLMSEFAKQPHPDAAHRDRLSKEIPGLSPRQVQVWFQNRRAKIKRLTADDRNQMIRMRAVPDDFDNVQALHSPYGAVHGMSAPMGPPVEFGNPNYGSDSMMRPLMVDVRRQDHDEHLSPTGLTPSFGGIGFNHGAGISSSELMSPITPTSADRYQFGGQMPTPLSAGPRLTSPLTARQNSLDGTMHMNRQAVRPLQPLHLRDPLTRSRSDSMNSPLRTSMSWKGEAIGYSTFPNTANGSDLQSRHGSVYDPNQMGTNSQGGQAPFESPGGFASNGGGYEQQQQQAGLTTSHSMSYSMSQQLPHSRSSRLRAASATIPPNLDFKDQQRASDIGSQSGTIARLRGPSSSSQLDSPSIYTTSYPPAPLTAPLEFSLSKAVPTRPSTQQDFSSGQLSAPISAPSDFSNAFQTGMNSQTSRTPMRESFGANASLSYDQGSSRHNNYGNETRGIETARKQSFALPGGPANSMDGQQSQS